MFFRDSTAYCLLSYHSCGSWQDGRKEGKECHHICRLRARVLLPPCMCSEQHYSTSGWAACPHTLLNHSWQFSLAGRAEGDSPEPTPSPDGKGTYTGQKM